MFSKDKQKNKNEYDVSKVRVRNSYYTFSKEYPGKNVLHTKRTVRKRRARIFALKACCAFLCFLAISLGAFFVTDLGLKFSYKSDSSVSDTEKADETSNVLFDEGIRGMCFPVSHLGDEDYMKAFVSNLKMKGLNSVVIDFKDKNGNICFSSRNKVAMLLSSAVYDNETVRNSLAFFKAKRLNVVARIYCFEDDLTAKNNESFSLKYLGSDVTWLDGGDEEGGKAWLNPFSKNARNFLLDIIKETVSFGVDGIILESVCFPYKGATDTVGFPERKDNESKNQVLLKFLSDAKKKAGKGVYVVSSLTASDAKNGNREKFDGSILKGKTDCIGIDISELPDGYVIDKKSKYISLISLLSEIKSKLSQDSNTLIFIQKEDYTSSLIRKLSKNGFQSYVIFDEEGIY